MDSVQDMRVRVHINICIYICIHVESAVKQVQLIQQWWGMKDNHCHVHTLTVFLLESLWVRYLVEGGFP